MKSIDKYITPIAWLGFICAVVAATESTYANPNTLGTLQHADFQYLPMLYRDLFLLDGKLSDWALTPAPYFFPDLPVYALLRLVSTNPNWTAIGASFLVSTSVAVGATYLVRQAGSFAASIQTLALLSITLLSFAQGWSVFATGLLCLSNHGGQTAISLACFAVLLQPTTRRVAGVALVSFATAVSDPLFVLGSLAPMVFLVWALSPQGRSRWLKMASLIAVNLGGVAVRARLPIPPTRGASVDMGRSGDALRAFVAHLGDAEAYHVYLAMALALVAVVLGWRDARRRAITVALVLSILSTLFGLWLIGAEVGTWGSRYLLLVHVALAMLAPLGMEALVKEKPFTVALALGSLVIAGASALSLGGNLRNVGQIRPIPMTCFDRVAEAHDDMHRCVASYWIAKPIAVLARKPVTVIQIRADGVPDWWINTRRYNADDVPVDCAVLPTNEAAYFVGRFGEPSTSVECEGHRIMTYSGPSRDRLNEQLQPLLHVDVPRRM